MHPTHFLHKVVSLRCQNIHKRRLNVLFDSVRALVDGSKLSLLGLGRNLRGKSKTKHQIKRIDRMLGNKNLHSERQKIYQETIKLVWGNAKRPLVLVDWSGLTPCGEFFMIKASTPVGGRSMTLYEETHLEKHYDSPRVNKRFLVTLKSLFPKDCRPIIVSDAGFRNPWFKFVKSLGWDFVGRVRGQTLLRKDKEQIWRRRNTLFNQASRKAKHLGEFELAKTNPLKCQLFLAKNKQKNRIKQNLRGHRVRCSVSLKHSKREREPWLIATSLKGETPPKKIIAIYKTRMQIELSFRDLKNQRYGFSFSESRSRCKERFDILLMVAMLGTLAVWLAGKIAENNNFQLNFQTNSIKYRRVLSIFYLGRQVLKSQKEKRPSCSYRHLVKTLHELNCITTAYAF